MAYQSLYDPMLYINDHTQIIQLCTTPFRDAAGFEESSCLRLLLDKRDASLGPWIPGRDLFEDELRAFQGGKDGLMPRVWANDFSRFPQPETISKTLVNQMLLCFGTMFASQDSGGMLSLLGIIEHCLRAGKKQSWHAFSVTNICVGLLAGLKSILAEGDICASQRRASCEGLGLLARLGNDTFTAKMTRSLLGDLTTTTDSFYAGSIALALGCIHRSKEKTEDGSTNFSVEEILPVGVLWLKNEGLLVVVMVMVIRKLEAPEEGRKGNDGKKGGIALSTLVPATVSSVSSLAKSSIASLQIWSVHGLLLTIEAAGLSFVSHVQGTLGLVLEILLSEENGQVHIQQGVGRLVNAIVAVIGPELSPGSIFFSRCKSVVAEISFWQETATLLERVRFTQQLVLFAPQAVSVHTHVQSLLPTLSSRQPTLRHLAVSTLRHLIEKDSDSIVDEQIEHHLFRMLDEETDSEYVKHHIIILVCLMYDFVDLLYYHAASFVPSAFVHSNYSDLIPSAASRGRDVIHPQETICLISLLSLESYGDIFLAFSCGIMLNVDSQKVCLIGINVLDILLEYIIHAVDDLTSPLPWKLIRIGNLVRTTILRLLYASCPSCPSHWISLFRTMVLSTSAIRDPSAASSSELDSLNNMDGEARLNFGEDDENMVSSSKGMGVLGYTFDASIINPQRGKHLRYRTRVFAAECLSHLPAAVGKDPAHFDLSLARRQPVNRQGSCDWLVLHVQELISLAYQISTLQFESMQPIGVRLLSTIIDKFEKAPDPELPGHILLEQYQAQLVSAVRIALDSSSGPDLLEAGLQLATKILTSGIISGDQVAVKRIYSLISRPLDDFKNLYYPSFAEWVSCKIKVRLLAAHASLKCFTYSFLRRHHVPAPDEYLALMPLFSKSSRILGKYWIHILKDYSYVCFRLHPKKSWKPFLDGVQSPLVSSKLQPCLEEAWPVILQALSLDAVPRFHEVNGSPASAENTQENDFISGYGMVELDANEFQFLWGFALLVLFQGQEKMQGNYIIPLDSAKSKFSKELPSEEINPLGLKSYEVVLPVFQFLSAKRFFSGQFLSMDVCKELLQVFAYSIHMEDSWNSLAISVMLQIVQNCPEEFLYVENFAYLTVELCLSYLLKISKRWPLLPLFIFLNLKHKECTPEIRDDNSSIILPDHAQLQDLISPLFTTAKILVKRLDPKKQLKVLLALLLVGFRCIKGASTDLSFSKVDYFFQSTVLLLKKHIEDKFKVNDDDILHWKTILVASLSAVARLTKEFIDGLHLLDNKRSNSRKLLLIKLTFSLEQLYSFAWLTHETVCLEENKCDPMFASTFKDCSKCFHEVLSDSDMQVQAIGLQVLKSTLQKEPNLEDNLFSMFFSGELIPDIFGLIQNNLKKLMARESVTITTECLRILVLMQTLSKETECQKRLINLLLEAVVLVFSATEDSLSQEVTDIRSTTLRLVSHLAQVPSSAVHFKDILLTMPVAHRQQLQGIIRASVTQDQSATQIKSTAPTLEIKLPVPTKVSSEKTSPPKSTTQHDGGSSSEEEEDDWDAFQSFPASTATDLVADTAAEDSVVAKNSLPFTNSEDNEFQQFSTSQYVNSERENTNEVSQEDSKQEVMSETVFSKDEIELLQDSRSNMSGGGPSANGRKGEDGVELQKENDLPSLTIQPVEDAEGSAGKNLAAGHEMLEGGLGNMSSQGIISGTPPLIESTDAEVLTQNAQSSLRTEVLEDDEAVENSEMFKPVEQAEVSPGASAMEGHEVSDENLGDFTSHETSSGKPPHKESNDTDPLVETPQSLKNTEVVEVIEDPKALIEKVLVMEDLEQAEESPNANAKNQRTAKEDPNETYGPPPGSNGDSRSSKGTDDSPHYGGAKVEPKTFIAGKNFDHDLSPEDSSCSPFSLRRNAGDYGRSSFRLANSS
ncbi:Laa1/Sip1/HEATR5-like, HEAT repeat region [Dillenia turbinata]|uniref:Laa1/Sip1/HEATR5-like, HEAT repeat region n=1 Tax=Dillenia turbinata TaxID=194707 RepID=A0AAN8UGB8_9MAGN